MGFVEFNFTNYSLPQLSLVELGFSNLTKIGDCKYDFYWQLSEILQQLQSD